MVLLFTFIIDINKKIRSADKNTHTETAAQNNVICESLGSGDTQIQLGKVKLVMYMIAFLS